METDPDRDSRLQITDPDPHSYPEVGMTSDSESPMAPPKYTEPKPRHWMSRDLKYSFASALLRRLCRHENKNFVISPLSLGTSLGMLVAGLRGESKTEVLKLLKASDEESLHSAFEYLLADHLSPLKIANKILAREDLGFREDAKTFLKVAGIRTWSNHGFGKQ